MGDDDLVQFGERVLAVLDGGRTTATYKYAVLLALIDCCQESTGADGYPPRTVSARRVSDAVLARYWGHAVPFSGSRGVGVLRQSSAVGDIPTRIADWRRARDLGLGSRLAEARRTFPEDFEALARDVHGTVCREPLPRLQTVGTQRQSFLYTLGWDEHVPRSRPRRPDFDDRIHFVGRAAEFLVRLSGLLRPLLEREWVARVARWNDDLVDPETLADFLFGTTRRSLQPVRGPLLDLQQGRCFYCDTTVREAAVDHFVPWARTADDDLSNLVAAHRRCNGQKLASLAAVAHLAHWRDRLQGGALDRIARRTGWSHDPERALARARAVYRWTPPATPLWRRDAEYEPWREFDVRRSLRPSALRAAENPPDGDSWR